MSSETPQPSADLRVFQADEVIFEEGDPADCAYMIRSGSVLIVKRTPVENIVFVKLLPNQAFGELALMDNTPRSATAIAAEQTEVMVITAPKFLAKIEALDPFMRNWFRYLKHRILDLSSRVEE
jgi:CRP/FNR family transcriptional regulator, cyclic AMP receptor protein